MDSIRIAPPSPWLSTFYFLKVGTFSIFLFSRSSPIGLREHCESPTAPLRRPPSLSGLPGSSSWRIKVWHLGLFALDEELLLLLLDKRSGNRLSTTEIRH